MRMVPWLAQSMDAHASDDLLNTKLVRRAIVDHLSDVSQTDKRKIYSACQALRISTRQVLYEGRLPA